MPGEADQTKWVGVRPTDPAETIPVSLSDPLGDINTKKAAPAISDLQAIKLSIGLQTLSGGSDLTSAFTVQFAAVPAGELWVCTGISAQNITDMCDMTFTYYDGTVTHYLNSVFSAAKFSVNHHNGFLVMIPTGYIKVVYENGSTLNNLRTSMFGYIIGIY